MQFQVRKRFDWDGKTYLPGHKINIAERHPRLDIMVRSGFIMAVEQKDKILERIGR